MTISSTLSKLTSSIATVPKPPLSLLRLGGMATPVGAGLVVGSVVALKAFEHRDEIKSTLGNIVHSGESFVKKAVSTTDKLSSKPTPADDSSSMLIPMLLVGGAVVVIFIVMRK